MADPASPSIAAIHQHPPHPPPQQQQQQQQQKQQKQHSHRPSRLRLACDACSATKVKCDKARPACQRCVAHQLLCVYSVSRRHGSQPWYKQTQQRHVQGQQDATSALSHAAFFPSPAGNPNRTPAASPSSYFLDPSPPANNNEPFPLHTSASWDDFDFALYGDHNALEVFNNNDNDNNYHIVSLSTPSVIGTPSTTSFAALPESVIRREHNCEAQASDVLRSLYYCPNYFTQSSTAATPANIAAHVEACLAPSVDDKAIPSVDRIILANRTALASVPDLLDCPCAQYPHLALLYIAILCKALFWYRVAVCAQGTRIPCADKNSQTPSAQHQTAAASSSRSGGVVHMQPANIHLGELQLDADDLATMQSGILLRELRKMDKTLQKLTALDVGWAADDARSGGKASATHWYRLAMPQICQELDALIQMATENRD